MKVNKKKSWQSGQKYNHKVVTNPVKVSSQEPVISIWTDGSCIKNPGGEGTWAFIVVTEGKITYEESGWERSTTNNRMELTAAKRAIEYCMDNIRDIQVVIHMDSDYAYSSITKWMRGWHKNNYVTPDGERKNADIFREIHPLLDKAPNVQYKWVRSHQEGEIFNNRADELCRDTYLTKTDAGWKPYTPVEYTDQQVTQIIQEGLENGDIQVEINDVVWTPGGNPDPDQLKEAQQLLLEIYNTGTQADAFQEALIKAELYLRNNNLIK